MTEASRKVWHCDGVLEGVALCTDWAWARSTRGAFAGESPMGWLELHLFGGAKHLCPRCATSANVNKLMDAATVSKIMTERGD